MMKRLDTFVNEPMPLDQQMLFNAMFLSIKTFFISYFDVK